MEKKVELELPKKYRIGIMVTIPMVNAEILEKYRETVKLLCSFMGGVVGNEINEEDVCNNFECDGKAIVSAPLIHSIAESKQKALNDAFGGYGIPIQAFLQMEE